MNPKFINLLLLVGVVVIAVLVIQPKKEHHYTKEETNNISKAIGEQFDAMRKKNTQSKKTQPNKPHPPMANKMPSKSKVATNESILGVIYKKTSSTWFIKAKGPTENINRIAATFKNYFVDNLKFDSQEQPDFSNIPKEMQRENTSSMRVATYQIQDVEVSVSKLAGKQDVFANVKRWMGQIGLNDNSKIYLDFKDNRNTILVQMPRADVQKTN